MTDPLQHTTLLSATTMPTDPTPRLTATLQASPDLIDRIFDYIVAEFPQMADQAPKLKDKARQEFAGEESYIAARPATQRQQQVNQVLALFNGRNATEVARRLQISRASVYRFLKQPGVDAARHTK